jgi:agmatine deiminase
LKISNGVIVLPKYYKDGMPLAVLEKDRKAVEVVKQAFPGREIVTVDPLAYNIGSGGGMHCSFQQEPRVAKKKPKELSNQELP